MNISGLVVTMSPLAGTRRIAMQAMERLPGVELGTANGSKVPAVIESPETVNPRAIFDRIRDIPGVLMVEVAYVWFGHQEVDNGPA